MKCSLSKCYVTGGSEVGAFAFRIMALLIIAPSHQVCHNPVHGRQKSQEKEHKHIAYIMLLLLCARPILSHHRLCWIS